MIGEYLATVSHGQAVFRCKWIPNKTTEHAEGFRCGRCNRGALGPRPHVGEACRICGARVEEATWPGKVAK